MIPSILKVDVSTGFADNEQLQRVLADTLNLLAEFAHSLPQADDFTERFMEIRDRIAWRA